MTQSMQNSIAIAITLLAAAWLLKSLAKRCFAPPCQPPSSGIPTGADGFIPLEQLAQKSPARNAP